MRKILVLLFAVTILYACSSESNSQEAAGNGQILLTGKVVNPQDGQITLSRYLNSSGEMEVTDTITLKDDKTFSEYVNVPAPGYYRLDFYGLQAVNLILDDENVNVEADGGEARGYANVTGSSDHDFITAFQQGLQEFQQNPDVRQINQAFMEAREQNDSETMDSLRQAYLDLERNYKMSMLQSAADTMDTSLGVVEILKNKQLVDPDEYFGFIKDYAVRVEEDMGDSPIAMEFISMVDNMEDLAIGAVAPEISLPNPEGEVIPLSSLRGNYVLVDFWAQWCRPCRMENPNVVAMYEKYSDQGFEVYGVSLDRSRDKWLQAIEEDNLHWTQVSDLKFWQSEAAQTYNISAIPFSVLLDPEGRIIGKNLRGAQLRQKLADIFGD
ncbi:MAG: TlpA disulfide reductase family protein [Cyclobacteriaceae bacterium]